MGWDRRWRWKGEEEEEETEERPRKKERKKERKMDAGVQYAVSRRLKNASAEAFVEIFRCLGGDVFFGGGFYGEGEGDGDVCVCGGFCGFWVDERVEGYCVERAGRDFLSVFVWTGLDWTGEMVVRRGMVDGDEGMRV